VVPQKKKKKGLDPENGCGVDEKEAERGPGGAVVVDDGQTAFVLEPVDVVRVES